uniref:NFACT protein C-terminal domain-containing protein n=1 Tax=Zooxanthella nutricula TaxID=1333877 RepID=A0A7S2QE97_9DINO
MAMVAPYCALGGPYAYRAKLTPGPGKKGQMARQCLRMFDAQTDRQAWKLLVQAIPENDAASLMMGSCKVSMPGMQKLQQQLQKDKKRDKQEPGKAPAR